MSQRSWRLSQDANKNSGVCSGCCRAVRQLHLKDGKMHRLELCAAAADSMSASRRRRFHGVMTSCRTPAIMWLDYCIMPFTMKLEDLQK